MTTTSPSTKCHRCSSPLHDPRATTCTPCRLELLAAIVRFRDRLATEIAQDAGPQDRRAHAPPPPRDDSRNDQLGAPP
jgi:hypothetical protein